MRRTRKRIYLEHLSGTVVSTSSIGRFVPILWRKTFDSAYFFWLELEKTFNCFGTTTKNKKILEQV